MQVGSEDRKSGMHAGSATRESVMHSGSEYRESVMHSGSENRKSAPDVRAGRVVLVVAIFLAALTPATNAQPKAGLLQTNGGDAICSSRRWCAAAVDKLT
jgi:hypothetical protein